MTTINLKDFYYWYLTDELVEVPDEVAEELMASKRREAAHAERVRFNKAYYSLDCDDGIEYSACLHEPSPQELMERKELFFRLWNALNSLSEIQVRVSAPCFRKDAGHASPLIGLFQLFCSVALCVAGRACLTGGILDLRWSADPVSLRCDDGRWVVHALAALQRGAL